MNQKLLSLVPARLLCPYCGEWHFIGNKMKPLKFYRPENYKINKMVFECPEVPSSSYHRVKYKIFFADGYCYYSTEKQCEKASVELDGRIEIDSITENSDEAIVTFKVPFTTHETVGTIECDCWSKGKCNLVALSDKGYDEITLGFAFIQSEYSQLTNELQKLEQASSSREKDEKTCEDTDVSRLQIFKQPKEDTIMAKNIFNINMEFGTNKDENIASALMGVAVKNGDNWRIYDKEKKEITDVGDVQIGNLPIFIMPTTKLSEGDLIKDAGEYYFVTKVAYDVTPAQMILARTGEVKTVVPTKNVLGFSCYSKIIALSDYFKMDDKFDIEKIAIMSTIYGQTGENGEQINQLLPLMLFKDKLGGDDDAMKLLLMSSMMNSKEDGGQMNQVFPLLLFKDMLSGEEDMMKMLLMSSMMADSNNPLISYLMLDSFMGTKDGNNLTNGESSK